MQTKNRNSVNRRARIVSVSKLYMRVLVFLVAGACALPEYVDATSMYKWVDKDGNTQYTQKPPPGNIEHSKLKPPPKIDSESSQNALNERQNKLSELREQRQKTEADKKTAAEEKARLKKNCETAKANLATYIRPRVTITEKDGSRVKATEEVRQQRLAETKQRIKEFCK